VTDSNGTSTPHVKFKLIAADELDKLPPVEFINGTHFATGGLNVVFGPPGSYKSFYVLGQVMEIAQQQPVVYVAPEGSRGFSIRKNAWKKHYSKPAGDLHFLCEEVNLLDTGDLAQFRDAIKPIRPKVIVFDTYARCLVNGDENSARDAGMAVLHCAQFQRWLNAAIVLVHHTNAGETRERGSTALRGAADVMIEMSTQDSNIVVTSSKMKDNPAFPTEHYFFYPVDSSGVLLPAALMDKSSGLGPTAVKILETLAMSIFREHGASCLQLHKIIKVSETMIYRCLSDLKNNDFLLQLSKGEPYRITDDGLIALSTHLAKTGQEGKGVDLEDLAGESTDSTKTVH
jgi:hypothetical protein